MRNRLLSAARTPWVSFLDDDDVLYPDHLAKHAAVADDADVVYSFCDVHGRSDWSPNEHFDVETLRQRNFIPATVSARADVLREVRGFRPSSECEHGWEDWDLWLRLLDAGARFICVPTITWLYRFHGGNKTYRGEGDAT